MSGLDLAAIHTALADQIRAGIDSSKFTVTAFPSTAQRPSIEVWPGSEYVNYYITAGPTGVADMSLTIRVFLSGANAESEWLTVARLLSSGTGHGSSLIDAVMGDRSLSDVVDDIVSLSSTWNPEDGSIDIPVLIQVRKQGAPV